MAEVVSQRQTARKKDKRSGRVPTDQSSRNTISLSNGSLETFYTSTGQNMEAFNTKIPKREGSPFNSKVQGHFAQIALEIKMLANLVRPIREFRMAYNARTCGIFQFCIMAHAEQFCHLTPGSI